MVRRIGFIKRTLIISAMSINVISSMSQVTIDECIALAKENYPLYKQKELSYLEEDCNLKSNSLKWAPQLSLNGKATYQSEVVEMPFEIPGYDFDISHYQYGVTADLSQMIWDGGVTRNNSRMVRANAEVKRKQLEVTVYNLRERVENLFLGILLLDKQIEQNRIQFENLERKQKDVESCIGSGVAYKSDLDMVKVNMLNCRQQETELVNNKSAYVKMLGRLVGKDLSGEKLVEPETDITEKTFEINRPELSLYDAQLSQNSIQAKELKTRMSPKFNFSFQLGAGHPGLNMLGNDFQPYYLAGIKMQWDIGSLYTFKSDRRKVDLQKKSIMSERETFILNTSLEMEEQLSVIDRIKKTIEMDDEIISMRERIKLAAEEQYAGGVIKMIDLMTIMTDEYNARLNKALHEIQLIMALRKYNNISGNR